MLPQQYQPEQYEALLKQKVKKTVDTVSAFKHIKPVVYASPAEGFRTRVEFRIWHNGDDLDYVMFNKALPKQPVVIKSFPIAVASITRLMPELKSYLLVSRELREGLFQVEFLATFKGDMLVTLVYHRALTEKWRIEGALLTRALDIRLVGRSKGQKLVISEDWIEEHYNFGDRAINYQYPEQTFTQPNYFINRAMLQWCCNEVGVSNTDLLELYCGIGNFTIALAAQFRQILATESSKRAIKAARYNCILNGISNVNLARLSAHETSMAISNTKKFRRLSTLSPSLNEHQLDTVLVDPPRSGLDRSTLMAVANFDRVVYFSCNPQTLQANLEKLIRTHTVTSFALFDQFPYTQHMECAVILIKRTYS